MQTLARPFAMLGSSLQGELKLSAKRKLAGIATVSKDKKLPRKNKIVTLRVEAWPDYTPQVKERTTCSWAGQWAAEPLSSSC
jgi:hypothetical protein